MPTNQVTAVVLAAGESTRMGSRTPKVMARLAGRTVLEWSARAFDQSPDVTSIVIVAPANLIEDITVSLGTVDKVEKVVSGGPTRSASTRAGLNAITNNSDGLVLVHDAARPLVTPPTISKLIDALAAADAATVATPAIDTMLRVSEDTVIDILDRSELWHAQTPQGFRIATLRAAFSAMGGEVPDFTDDCALVRRYLPTTRVAVVPGAADNIKITRPNDLELAESLLAAQTNR
jgi:2-C-methyl-D-erythritol 4-phosphate cytidylyltransferase